MKNEKGKRVPKDQERRLVGTLGHVGHEVAGQVPTASPSVYVVAILFDYYLF
jgi:hypothetical protein